jgi:hypothetical protein
MTALELTLMLDSIIETNGMSNDNLVKFFSDGLGLELTSNEGTLLKGVVEMDTSKAPFCNEGNWIGLTPALTILPFLWQMRKNSHFHHVADIYMSVSIVAEQLGFYNVLSYLEVHGWTFKAQGGMPTIQYHKLEQVITQPVPTGKTATLVMNFKAMVDKLHA